MDRSLVDTFSLIKAHELLLPDFQRDYKWNIPKQQSLMASILLNFPVGSSLILKGHSDDFALRKIGETGQFSTGSSDPCEYLLDGQQRTTTLYNAFNDVYNFSKFSTLEELTEFVSLKANPMKVRWFIRVPVLGTVNESVTDLFGASKVKFDKETADLFEPDDIIDVFNGETFNEKNNKGVSKWFSPYYQLKLLLEGKTEPQIATQFVEDCVNRGMIPLYLVGSKPALVSRILKGIAEKNAQAIRDEFELDFEHIKSNYDSAQVFDGYSSIEEFESDGLVYSDELDNIFVNCKNDWQNDVKNYLIKDIYETYSLSSIVTDDIRRAIPIFCHLNDGGMPLDDFDLVSAKAAKKLPTDTVTYSMSTIVRNMFSHPFILCDTLKYDTSSRSGLLDFSNFDLLEDGLPKGYVSKAILAICTALAIREKSNSGDFIVKKKDTSSKTLLSLDTETIREYMEIATEAVQRAISFLICRCGVYNGKKLHYKLMIQPIAYVLADDGIWNSQSSLKRVEYWYWSSAFSGRYLYDQSAVVIEDINQLYDWVKNDEGSIILGRESKIFDDDKYCSKDLLTQKLNEYPKEGIHSLILQYVLSESSSYDLLADRNEPLNSYQLNTNGDVTLWPTGSSGGLNDHHIIPLGMITGLGEKTEEIRKDPNHKLNTPLNRVLISSDANNAISSMDPSRYFADIPSNSIVLQSLLIGSTFGTISTSSSESAISTALEERFDNLVKSVGSRLLKLRT
ncbi:MULTISPECIES: DUF262 domain-containing protein [Vibrio]|uniref:DUF262 domain-containing protein n=1 Tax=Vibrio TaxID=662 RepID=UPI0011B74C73|nr:DUF262 domain-containing protein [Vibrio cyclitrophicus]